MMKKFPGLKSGSDAQTRHSFGRRSRRAVFCSLGAAALLVLPGVALAQGASGAGPAVGAPASGAGPFWGRGGGRGMRGPGTRGQGMRGQGVRGERMAKAIGLSDAQVKQMKAMRDKQQADMGKLRLQKQRIRAQMRVEWLKDAPDQAKLRSLSQQMSKVEAEKAKMRLEMRLKMSSVLTPAQRAKAKTLGIGPGSGPRGGKGMGRGFGRGGGHGKGMRGGGGRGRRGGGGACGFGGGFGGGF